MPYNSTNSSFGSEYASHTDFLQIYSGGSFNFSGDGPQIKQPYSKGMHRKDRNLLGVHIS